jgi:hypothetical protein
MTDFNQSPPDQPSVALSLAVFSTATGSGTFTYERPPIGFSGTSLSLSHGSGGSGVIVYARPLDGRIVPIQIPEPVDTTGGMSPPAATASDSLNIWYF